MKLSTLLLSSAAVIVAGSAYAADLPAKKGAPAAKAATGCPAFGAGFFQIPGGDTCIKFSGYIDYVGSSTTPDSGVTSAGYSQGGNFRIITDVRSNTDLGVLRGVARVTNASLGRAYVEVAGLTAGYYGSTTDISGTGAWNYGSSLGGGTGKGIKYTAAMGSTSIIAALENSADNNYTATNLGDRPDLILGMKSAIGGVDLQAYGISHQVTETAATQQGYAFVGKAGVTMGTNTFAVYGGTSKGALLYTGVNSTDDSNDGGDLANGTNYGATAGLGVGTGTLNLAYTKSESTLSGTKTSNDLYGISYNISPAKQLQIEPEVTYTAKDVAGAKTNTTVVYLRIARDFWYND